MGHFFSWTWAWPSGEPGMLFFKLSLEKTHELRAFSGARQAWKC
jgi:hypothetical protein